MEITLNSVNGNGTKHSFLIIQDKDRLILCTKTGHVIATIRCDTMLIDCDPKQPTEGFYVYFDPSEHMPMDKNIATVPEDKL